MSKHFHLMPSIRSAILFLTSWYPVEYNSSHGIFIRNHAIALSQFRKVIVVYAYCSRERPHYQIHKIKVNDNFTEYYIRYTKPFFNWPPFSSVIQLLKYKKAHRLLLRNLLKTNIEISAVQVNVVFPAALVLDLYKKKFNVQHTVVEHWSGYLPEDGNYKGCILKRVTKKCLTDAKKVWHISQPQKEAMLSHGLNAPYELIYNAVDTSVFMPGNTKSNRIQLLHVSSLVDREKNISGTFRVIKLLKEKGYDFDFIVAGGGEVELKAAIKLAHEMQLQDIEFKGTLIPSQIARLMQQATALVLFSHFEGMPVVALEALSCELPVIASRVGQLPYMISQEMGILVESKNEKQMFDALEKVILKECHFNPHVMREFVIKYASYEAVGKQLSECYQ